MVVTIDWKHIGNEEEFYDVFLPQVGAPDWHGRNLDALNDSLVAGDINDVIPPYCIMNINTSQSPHSLKEFQRKVLSIFIDAAIENQGIEIILK